MSPPPRVHLGAGDFAVLTLTEPWATLCVLGEKEWETRSWPTSFRGRILIHAAKGMPTYAQQTCLREPFESVLLGHGISLPAARPEDLSGASGQRRFAFHFGAIVGAVQLVQTARTEKLADELRRAATLGAARELAFGNYDAGRWAFRFASPVRLKEPVPVVGSLGIWSLGGTTDAGAAVRAQLELSAVSP